LAHGNDTNVVRFAVLGIRAGGLSGWLAGWLAGFAFMMLIDEVRKARGKCISHRIQSNHKNASSEFIHHFSWRSSAPRIVRRRSGEKRGECSSIKVRPPSRTDEPHIEDSSSKPSECKPRYSYASSAELLRLVEDFGSVLWTASSLSWPPSRRRPAPHLYQTGTSLLRLEESYNDDGAVQVYHDTKSKI
jgi:hypothetical protein